MKAHFWVAAVIAASGPVAMLGAAPGMTGLALVSTACVPAPDGVVGWWSGDSTNDVLNRNNATPVGPVAYGRGIVGSAFRLDGQTTWMTVPENPSLDLPVYSVEAWIYFTGEANWHDIIAKGWDYAENYRLQVFDPSYSIEHALTTATERVTVDTPENTLLQSTWTHVAATYDGGTSTLYVNGQLLNRARGNGPAQTDTYDLFIGRPPEPDSGWHYAWPGMLDEVTLYSRALSAGEIQSIYNAGSAGKCKPPIFVAAMRPFLGPSGVGTTVTIADTVHQRIPNARVAVSATLPDQTQQTLQGVTGSDGTASVTISPAVSGTYTFTVTHVSLPTWPYRPARNLVTSDSITVP